MRNRKIVLLIDAENTSARYAKRIVEHLEKRGDIICARIYGDFINNSSVKGWNSVAIEYEMEQKQQLTTSAGKNSSDIALVIDAMDLLYQKNIDTLCIVTSDGDFTGLVKRIREDGIEVIGIGKADASKRLEKVCDQYLDFDELAEETAGKDRKKNPGEAEKKADKKTEKKQDKKQAKAEKGKQEKVEKEKKSNKIPSKSSHGGNSLKVGTRKAVWGSEESEEKIIKTEGKTKDSDKKAGISSADVRKQGDRHPDKEKLGEIKTAIHEIVQQEEKNGKHAELGGIKSQLQMKYPGFDENEFGYKTIRELINAETKFQVVLEGRHTYVVPEKAAGVIEKEKQPGSQSGKQGNHEPKGMQQSLRNKGGNNLQNVNEAAASKEHAKKKTGLSFLALGKKKKIH